MKSNKAELIEELQRRVEDKILEPTNFELLKKLIERADTLDEAIMIAELGTTYKRTGFHFDKRLEKVTDTIKYFKKNEELSFATDSTKKTHKLIIGDNYPALLNLFIEYKGAIDIIYIDPPYGKDRMGEFAQTNYENAITRDNLLSMLYPRLLLAKMLLSDEGVIFCSIDDRNQAYVKGLLDEIFGESNFIGLLPRVTKKSGKQHSDNIAKNHDYIIVYAKDNVKSQFKGENVVDTAYPYSDEYVKERGPYKLNQTLDYDTLWYNPAMDFQIKVEDDIFFPGGSEEKHNERHNGNHKSKDWVWRWSQAKFDFGYENGFVVIKRGKDRPRIYTKTYVNAKIAKDKNGSYCVKLISRESNLSSIALVDNEYSNDNAKKELDKIIGSVFDNPKSTTLIKKLISLINKEDVIVLDFFAGSGTTGHAVLEMNREDDGNRQFILVTNNEITEQNPNGIAYDVTTKRLKRVMTGECYDGIRDFKWLESNTPLGDNFDVYEIAEVANFEATEGKTPFDVIDETLYGVEKFATVQEKVEWVCDNFEITQKKLEEN